MIKDSILLAVEQGIKSLLSLLTLYWFSRSLGEVEYGKFQYVLSIIVIAKVFAGLGLRQIIVRECTLDLKNSKAILVQGIYAQFIFSVIFSVLLGLYFLTKKEENLSLIYFVLSLDLVFRFNELFRSYFESKLKIRSLVLLSIISTTLTLVFRYSAVTYFRSEIIIYFSYIFEAIILFFLFSIYLRLLRLDKLFSYFKINKKLLAKGLPLLISSSTVILYMRADVLFIEYFMGYSDVANYSIAVRFSEILFLLSSIISTAILPRFLNDGLKANDLNRIFKVQLVGAAIVVVILLIFFPMVLTLLFPNEFTGVNKIFSILIFNIFLVIMGSYTSLSLMKRGLENLLARRSLEALGLNVVMNLILIPKIGLVGAAYATVLSQLYAGLIFDLTRLETRDIFRLKINLFLSK